MGETAHFASNLNWFKPKKLQDLCCLLLCQPTTHNVEASEHKAKCCHCEPKTERKDAGTAPPVSPAEEFYSLQGFTKDML